MPKVLFIEWTTTGRDFEIDLPLMYFFEKILHWEIEYLSIFNLPKIIKTTPDLIIMSNTIGAIENLNIARLIERGGYTLFSHSSEGMFIENNIEDFVWGWGKNEKHLSEVLSMQWSKKSYNMATNYFPNLTKKYRVSGAVGHDKYQIFTQNQIQLDGYNKIIGYAAYDFITIFQSIENNLDYMVKRFGGENLPKTKSLAQSANDILKYIISKNTDILFLLKPHPADADTVSWEFKGLLDFPNIRIIGKGISITEVIQVSDIWLNVNSTTNLEAWLCNKPSISFNTFEDMFATDVIYGSIIEKSPDVIQSYIEEFYATGNIKKFEEKKELRKKLIKNYIGFSDGLNHVRFMSFLKPFIERVENNQTKKGTWILYFKEKFKGYIKHIVYSIAKGKYNTPILKRWANFYGIFNIEEIQKQKQLRYIDFDNFYSKNQNIIDNIYNTYANDWEQISVIDE